MNNVANLYEAREKSRAEAAAALVVKYPWLIPDKGNALVSAAKNIRLELARAFPGVKFRVNSRRFSMGDSIDVHWVDGPCTDMVNPIINKYAAGNFDGMDDSYNYVHSAWTRAFGDAKYVNSSRDYSDRAVAACIRTVATRYAANLARTPALPLPVVEDFRKGRLWNMVIASLSANWGELLNVELSRRTWILERKEAA